MRKFDLAYAKDHLESLVEEAITGQEVVIKGPGARLVRLTPVGEHASRRADAEARRSTVEGLCSRLRSLPDLDSRSAEEILGYDDAYRAHCRDAPWGVSEAGTSVALPQTPAGTLRLSGPSSPPQRRPTGRLYSGGRRLPHE